MNLKITNYFITANGKSVLDATHYILGSSSCKLGNYRHLSQILKNYLNAKGKRVLNSKFSIPLSFKFNTYVSLSASNVPIIDTFIFPNINALEQNKHKLPFPLIIKHGNKSKGKDITKINNIQDLETFQNKLNDDISKYMFQEYVDTGEKKEDYRIVTVGNEIVGGYKRIAPEGKITTNTYIGGDYKTDEKIEINDELRTIVTNVIKATQMEFTGIDLIYKNNKPVIIEVNSSPQFERFEAGTKINLVEKILNYLLKS